MKNFYLLILTFFLISTTSTSVLAQAAIDVPIDDQLRLVGVQLDLGSIVSSIVTLLMTLGLIALLLFLVRGAYMWMSAGGDKAKVEEARSVITNSIIGMTILASVFAFFAIINEFFGIGINVGL